MPLPTLVIPPQTLLLQPLSTLCTAPRWFPQPRVWVGVHESWKADGQLFISGCSVCLLCAAPFPIELCLLWMVRARVNCPLALPQPPASFSHPTWSCCGPPPGASLAPSMCLPDSKSFSVSLLNFCAVNFLDKGKCYSYSNKVNTTTLLC